MSDEQTPDKLALAPVREQTVDFYGDALPAAQLADGTVWVPLRPIADHLGLDWSAQFRRMNRDPVLAEAQGVAIMATASGQQEMICLPLKLLPGWLFGISASRVKDELREKILRYQRDCYEVLWNAFKGDIMPLAPQATDLSQAELAVENARALLHLAEQQLEFERRLTAIADYMRPFVKDTRLQLVVHDQRLTSLELQLSAGATISESDAAEVQLAVKNVGSRLQGKAGMTGYQQVYAELYRRYRVSSYKNLPAARLREVLDWLHGWFDELNEAKHD